MIALAPQLPREVERYIDRFVARRRTQRLLRAAAQAVLFTIVWALIWCVIDRFFALDAATRAIGLGINLAIVALILARPAIAMVRRVDPDAAAVEIERREPRMSQRLRTITSRMRDADEHAYGSSRELLDALARQVADDVRDRNPAALLSWRPVVRPAAAACAAWVIIAWVASQSSWLDLPTLARRYFTPFSQTPAVTTTRLIVLPGDAEITQGDPLRVQASAVRLAAGRSLALHVRARTRADAADAADATSAHPWHVEPMTATPADAGKFEAQIARVDRDLEYFVTGGDARSGTFRVAMLPRPAVERFRIRYIYPPHTGLAPREVANETGAIEAPAGTEATLALETKQPLSYAIMTIGSESIRITPTAATQPAAIAGAAAMQTSFMVNDDRRYTLRMVGDRGVSGVFRGGTIRAIADRAPIAQFREGGIPGGAGGGTRDVGGGDVLPMAYQAVDDYGLARLDVDVRVVRKSGAEANASLPVPLTAGRREQQGVVPVELRQFALEAGDAVELRLQAEDRAGQFALSAPLRFAIAAAAPPQSSPPPQPTATAPPATAPSRPERAESPPLDPPGYEAAIRAYFDALRRAAPTTRP